MTATVQYDLTDLLIRAGAKPPRYERGKWDCPWCNGRARLSVDLQRGLFHCFGPGCQFKGNTASLARQLGLSRRLTAAESWQLRQERERADRLARELYHRVQARRFELLGELRALGRLELLAHDAGPTNPASMPALALCYERRPQIEAGLDFLEQADAASLVRRLYERAD